MQHIALNIINEKGGIIKASDINFAKTMLSLFDKEDYERKFPWLSTVDPYGLTVFNGLQIKHLVHDLKSLRDLSENKSEYLIEESIDFIQQSGDLQLIQFIGD